MAKPAKAFVVTADDAPQHTDTLLDILRELQTENRISDFTTMDVHMIDSLTDKVNDRDVVLVMLTQQLDALETKVNRVLRTIKAKHAHVAITEIIIDKIEYDNNHIALPPDLKPIRSRNDMDAAWRDIGRTLRDLLPVPQKKTFPVWLVIASVVLVVILAILLFGYFNNEPEEPEPYQDGYGMSTELPLYPKPGDVPFKIIFTNHSLENADLFHWISDNGDFSYE